MSDLTLGIIIAVGFVVVFVVGLLLLLRYPKPKPKTAAELAEREKHRENLKKAWRDTVEAWKQIPAEGQDKIRESVGDVLAPPRTLVVPNAVVTYRFNPQNPVAIIRGIFSVEDVEEKIKAILSEVPTADLTKHEAALGIKIIDVQRRGETGPGGIIIGSEE